MRQVRQYRGPLSVAVVDDDATYRAYAAALLTQSSDVNGAVETWEAADGDGLLDILQRRTVDCVVLDYNLGEESGLSIHERIKTSGGEVPPVVMLTGDGREQTVIKAFKGGVSDYLPKRSLVRGALTKAVREAVQARLDERSKRAEDAQLRRMSVYDSLTGLFTRAHIDERLAMLDSNAQRTGARYAIVLINLHDLDCVIDRFGQAAGDRVLRAFATRLRQATRQADICGRFEATEFLYFIDTDAKRETVKALAHQLGEALRFEVNLDEMSLTLAPTIGAALYPDDSRSLLGVVDAARRASQDAKATRRRYAMATNASFKDRVERLLKGDADMAREEWVDEPSAGTVSDTPKYMTDRRRVEREGDRRCERRQRVLKQARIVLDDRASAVDCTIRDLSMGGARLRLDSYFAPPAEFALVVVNSGETRRVKVRWQVGNEVGVAFVR